MGDQGGRGCADERQEDEQRKRKASSESHQSLQELPATAAGRLLPNGPKRRQSPDLDEVPPPLRQISIQFICHGSYLVRKGGLAEGMEPVSYFRWHVGHACVELPRLQQVHCWLS